METPEGDARSNDRRSTSELSGNQTAKVAPCCTIDVTVDCAHHPEKQLKDSEGDTVLLDQESRQSTVVNDAELLQQQNLTLNSGNESHIDRRRRLLSLKQCANDDCCTLQTSASSINNGSKQLPFSFTAALLQQDNSDEECTAGEVRPVNDDASSKRDGGPFWVVGEAEPLICDEQNGQKAFQVVDVALPEEQDNAMKESAQVSYNLSADQQDLENYYRYFRQNQQHSNYYPNHPRMANCLEPQQQRQNVFDTNREDVYQGLSQRRKPINYSESSCDTDGSPIIAAAAAAAASRFDFPTSSCPLPCDNEAFCDQFSDFPSVAAGYNRRLYDDVMPPDSFYPGSNNNQLPVPYHLQQQQQQQQQQPQHHRQQLYQYQPTSGGYFYFRGDVKADRRSMSPFASGFDELTGSGFVSGAAASAVSPTSSSFYVEDLVKTESVDGSPYGVIYPSRLSDRRPGHTWNVLDSRTPGLLGHGVVDPDIGIRCISVGSSSLDQSSETETAGDVMKFSREDVVRRKRRREQNRRAAKKCREKKKENVDKLMKDYLVMAEELQKLKRDHEHLKVLAGRLQDTIRVHRVICINPPPSPPDNLQF